MDLAHIIAFNATLLAAMASPGPALLLALKTTLTSGRIAGMATGLGLGTAAALWTGLALLGLEGIFALFPWAYVALKSLGAAYLVFIAYKMWKEASKSLDESPEKTPGLRRAFFTGFGVNIGNPKSVVFSASVLLVIFPQNMSIADKMFIALNHLAVEWVVYAVFAMALSTGPARNGYLRLKPIFDRAAALLLGALGLRLIFSK